MLGHVFKLKPTEKNKHVPKHLTLFPPVIKGLGWKTVSSTFMQSSRRVEDQGAEGIAPSEALPSGQEEGPCKYLVDVVQLKVLEQQQQDSRNGLNNDLFVAVHIHPQLHALQHCGAGNTVPG